MDNRLPEYIKQELTGGVKKDVIIKKLLDLGWKIEIVNNAFSQIESLESKQKKSESFFDKYIKDTTKASSFLIRIGLAFVFLYAAIFMTLDPDKYIIYFPNFMRELVPGHTLLHAFAVFEVILSLFLILGLFPFFTAFVSFITMFALTVVNLEYFSSLFRNVSIIMSALALVILAKKNKI